jgi:hypothetical protein
MSADFGAGFAVLPADSTAALMTPQAVPQGAGAAIGNFTAQGGLATAFDGVVSQSYLNCAMCAPSVSGYGNVLGKDWGGDRLICGFVLYGPSDDFFLGNNSSNGLKLQGSTDGLVWIDLWTGVYPTGVGKVVSVSSGVDTAAAFRMHRVNLFGNGVNASRVSELQFLEIV